MIITNKFNLPEVFVRAVENDPYTKGGADYSATELVGPVQIAQLKRRHEAQIIEDVSDAIWKLLGKGVHHILEQAGTPQNALSEERLVQEIHGRKISGAADIYHNGIISDYKVTSVWTAKYGSRAEDWTAQLNIYKFLFESIGFEVNGLEVVCIFRDWSVKEKVKYPGWYPACPVVVTKLESWNREKVETFINDRLMTNMEAEELPDEDLPRCSDAETWLKKDLWAVMKEGQEKAIRGGLCDTQEEAETLCEKSGGEKKKFYVQFRPGERTRCESYCPVRPFCKQFEKEMKPHE